jgi:hypothetical protein
MPEDVQGTTKTRDEALLKEIRERYQYFSDRWREAREERKLDMRYLSGDPWEPEDRKARKDAGRPCVNHDELNQYVNQAVNSIRQNKRAVKVEPAGNGTTDKSAELEQSLIRTAEYRSQAQAAYLTAYECALSGGYGYFRVSRRWKRGRTFEQELAVTPIENPDSVLYDPDCKQPDWSDPRAVFVLEPMLREDFKREYPKAEVRDFSSEDMKAAPGWITDKHVLVAEYWRVEPERLTLYLLDSGEVVDELPEGVTAVRQRSYERKKVVQYITNGVEILERNEQPDDYIPIVLVPAKKVWVDEGDGQKWKLISLVRFARDPQMSLAYLCSQEMEEAGLSPKTPYVGYKGQFESDTEAWATANKIPHSYLQVDPVIDTAGGQQLAPLPRREQFTPNFGAYEVAKEAARRAIQAAMGISPLPTAAQRNNEKSGVALQRIQAQQEIGSFHFVDNYDRALAYAGRIMEAYLAVTYDTEREEALTKPDGSKQVVKLNTAEPYPDPQTNEPKQYQVPKEEHDVTISTGPSADSQREAASDFLDLLIQNLATLPVAPPQRAKLLSMAIKMKQLGPLGDEMADTVSPSDNEALAPKAQQIVAQLQQQLQALNAYAQQKESEVQELQQKIAAKVVEAASRRDLEQMKIEADLAKAEITTKAQNLSERLAFIEDLFKQLQIQRHEAEMKAADQSQQQEMAAQQAAEAAQQQETPAVAPVEVQQ